MKKRSKKLMLAKETLSGLGLAQGGSGTGYSYPSSPYCGSIVGCGGGGGGDTSAGFYADPGACTG